MDKATGVLTAQAGGYTAFIPHPLPPKNLDLRPLQTVVSKADQALGRLDGSVGMVPDIDHFVSLFVLKEAVLSSQIEGTRASLVDVLESEAQPLGSASVDVKEVVNYVDAMNHGIELLETLPLSRRLIQQVHARLMHEVRGGEPSKTPGEFRKSQNWIGGASPASARFVPPPFENVSNCFGDLEKFINEDSTLPHVVVAGLAHAQFETIHPFLDGNGRTGRLLITFYLLDKKVISRPILYPSLYLKREQDEYVRRLQDIREHGAWHEWLEFFVDAVAEAAKEATDVAVAVVQLREVHRGLIARTFGKRAGNALVLLEHLYSHPITSGRQVEEVLGTSQPTASSLLRQFEDVGILVENTGGERYRRYSYTDYLDLFPFVNERS